MVAVQSVVEGFLLGVTTGHICLATCGPVYSSFLMQHNRKPIRYVTALIEMSAGRFVMYLCIGAVAGLIGTQIPDIQREYFTVVAYTLFSVFLLISAFRSNRCDSGCSLPKWNRFAEWPFVLGLLTGINICPSFLLAFSRSFVLSGPVAGMLFFGAFFIGTSIFLVPLSFIGMFGRKKLFRSIARIASVLVAIWFIGVAIRTANSLTSPYFDKRPVINLLDETPAYVLFETDAETYGQRLSMVRKGKVTITDSIIHPAGHHYIITDSIHMQKDSASLRAAGCFVAVVNSKYFASPDSFGRVIEFMKMYSFRFDTKKGDVFYIR